MKKTMKRVLAAMMAVLCAVCVFTGCGSRKPKAVDAQNYVKAILDIICTGDYDHSVKFSDLNEDTAKQTRDEILDGVEEALAGSDEIKLPEETIKKFREVKDKALQKCRYTVGDAVAADDGFDVKVSIEPLVVMDSAKFSDGMMAYLLSVPGIAGMNQEQITAEAMNYLITCIEEGLEDPQYDSSVDVTVHYGVLEENNYGVSEEDGQRLGEKLFISR